MKASLKAALAALLFASTIANARSVLESIVHADSDDILIIDWPCMYRHEAPKPWQAAGGITPGRTCLPACWERTENGDITVRLFEPDRTVDVPASE